MKIFNNFKNFSGALLLAILLLCGCKDSEEKSASHTYEPGYEYNLYAKPLPGMQTRWMTGENPNGEKGAGGYRQ